VPQTGLHGGAEILVGYGIAVAGLLIGSFLARARLRRLMLTPLLAVAVLIVSAVLWSVVLWADPRLTALARGTIQIYGFVFTLAVALVAGIALGARKPGVTHKRGTVLADGVLSGRSLFRPGDELALAGQPIPRADETKHFKLIGTTGTGKSTAIRELLKGAIERGDRAVIADPDGSYLKALYNAARGDAILNPFNERAARWDLFAEVIQLHDADQLARSLIPDHEGSDRSWRHYARTFVTAIVRQLHRVDEHDLAKLYYLLIMAPVDELRELLEPTPAGPFLGSDNGKFFESVRSVANVHVAALEHLASQTTGPLFSVRKWVREGRGVLFLPYRASEIAALRYIVSTWMRLGIFEAMNGPEGDQRLWFIVDELDALGAIDGLKDALARLRKFGGRCVLGFQSIAQVRGTYGDAEAQTIVENCGNTLILRCSASERGGTAEFASRLIGKREIVRSQVSHNLPGAFAGSGAHRTKTLSDQHVTEDAVMASEIEQLPDLTGFLKLASRPEWRRVQLRADQD